jgi:hypothetical protein
MENTLLVSYSRGAAWRRNNRNVLLPGLTERMGFFISLLMIMGLMNMSAAAYDCRGVLVAADLDNDSTLNRAEFTYAVNMLSGGGEGFASFEELPSWLQETFDDMACHCERQAAHETCCESSNALLQMSGLYSSLTPPPEKHGLLFVDMCTRIQKSVHVMDAMDASSDTHLSRRHLQGNEFCYGAMADSDLNGDDLMNQLEYLIFLNILTENDYLGLTFGQLPLELRRNYFQLRKVESGQIDVTGTKEGQVPTAEQTVYLDDVCSSTEETLESLQPPTNSPSAAPSIAPTPDGATSPPLDQDCLDDMAASDIDNDNQLNQRDYTIFVLLLSDNGFDATTFSDLPLELRRNFFQLRDPSTNQIDIAGSKPGDTPTAEQAANLSLICTQTNEIIDSLLAPSAAPTAITTNPSPTVAPTPAPTTTPPVVGPTIAPLTEIPTSSPSTQAPTLPPTPPPTSSPTLVPTGQPSPFPSATPTFSPSDTPTTSIPTSSPSSVPSSVPTEAGFSGGLVIESKFAMSNSAGLTAASLQSGTIRRSLDLAYLDVVTNVTETLDNNGQRIRTLRSLRGRRLTVDYVNNTAIIDSIVDTQCPSNLPFNVNCQLVTGMYNLSLAFEDAEVVREVYTNATDSAINNGLLQDSLPESTPLTIIGSVDGDSTSAPSSSPTVEPNIIDGGSDGLSTGAIIGIVLVAAAGVALAAGGGYYWMRKSGGRPKMPRLKPSPAGPIESESVRLQNEGPPRDDGYAGDRRSQATRTEQESPGSSSSYSNSLFSKSPEQDRNRFSRYEDESSYAESSVGQSPLTPGSARDDNASHLDDYQYDDPNSNRGTPAVRSQDTSEGSSGWDDSESDSESSESEYTSPSTQDFRESAGVAAAAADESVDAAPEEDSESESSSSYEESSAGDSSPAMTPDPPSGQNSAAFPAAMEGSPGGGSSAYTTSDDGTYEESEEGDYESAGSPAALRPQHGVAPPSVSSADHGGMSPGGAAALGAVGGAVGGAALMAAARRRKDSESLSPSESKVTDADDLESLVEQRDWDGIIATAERYEQEAVLADSSSETTKDSASESVDEDTLTSGGSAFSSRLERSLSGNESRSGEDSSYETGQYTATDYTPTTATATPEDARRRAEYKAEVEALVRIVVPEEIDNVDVMMEQFRDRESELISTLRTMQERSVTQRARAAVHKSRSRPVRPSQLGASLRDTAFSVNSRDTGRSDTSRTSAAGAAIAAASVPRPATGRAPPPPTVPENRRTSLATSRLLESPTSAEESDYVHRRESDSSPRSPVSTSGSSESYSSTSGNESTEQSGSLDDLPSRWKETTGTSAREAPRQEVSKSKPWLRDEQSESMDDEHPSVSIGGF